MDNREKVKTELENMLEGFSNWTLNNKARRNNTTTHKAVVKSPETYHSEFMDKLMEVYDKNNGYDQGYEDAINKIKEAVK